MIKRRQKMDNNIFFTIGSKEQKLMGERFNKMKISIKK